MNPLAARAGNGLRHRGQDARASRSPDNKAIYATCSANSPIGLAPDGIFHFHLEAAGAKIHERGETRENVHWHGEIAAMIQTVLILWLATGCGKIAGEQQIPVNSPSVTRRLA